MKTINDEEWKKYFLKHFPDLATKYSKKINSKDFIKKNPFKNAVKQIIEFFNFINIKSSLCEKCKYNSPRYCVNAERPFAIKCNDYEKK